MITEGRAVLVYCSFLSNGFLTKKRVIFVLICDTLLITTKKLTGHQKPLQLGVRRLVVDKRPITPCATR